MAKMGMSSARENGFWRVCLWTHLMGVLVLLYLPLLILLLYSFSASQLALRFTGFSLQWYAKALHNPEVLAAIANSLGIALASGGMATALGTLLALGLERGSRRLRQVSELLAYLPILIPEIILGLGLLVFFARGLRPMFAGLGLTLDSFTTVTLGHVTLSLSYVCVAVRSRLKGYNSQTELAALDLGANQLDVLLRIILPQMGPAIFSGFLMAVSLSLDDFYVSYFVTVGGSGFKTVPLYIWGLQGRSAMTPEINAVATLMLVFSALALGVALLASRGVYGEKGKRA